MPQCGSPHRTILQSSLYAFQACGNQSYDVKMLFNEFHAQKVLHETCKHFKNVICKTTTWTKLENMIFFFKIILMVLHARGELSTLCPVAQKTTSCIGTGYKSPWAELSSTDTAPINTGLFCGREERERGGHLDKCQVMKREGSVRVSQWNYTGEEGWEIEVCNWLPGED